MHHQQSNVPGMITGNEWRLLFDTAAKLPLEPNDKVLEFGTFLGKSTEAIFLGLRQNKDNAQCALEAYDSYVSPKNGRFAKILQKYCAESDTNGLLKTLENEIDFYNVCEFFLKDYIKTGHLKLHQKKLKDIAPYNTKIAMIHIDSAKSYDDLSYIIDTQFFNVKSGGSIVFQDFFFHWSATLIAAASYFIKEKYLKPVARANSTLLCDVTKPITLSAIYDLKKTMQNTNSVSNLISWAERLFKSRPTDPYSFRLYLARMQFLYEAEDMDNSAQLYQGIIDNGSSLHAMTRHDVVDLFAMRFNSTKIYD